MLPIGDPTNEEATVAPGTPLDEIKSTEEDVAQKTTESVPEEGDTKHAYDLDDILQRRTYSGKIMWSTVQEMALRDNKKVFDDISSLTVKTKVAKSIEEGIIKSKLMKEDKKLDVSLARQVISFALQQTESKNKKKSRRLAKKELLDDKAKLLLMITDCVIESNFRNQPLPTAAANVPEKSSFDGDLDNGDEELQVSNEKVVELEKELEVAWKKSNILNYIRVPSSETKKPETDKKKKKSITPADLDNESDIILDNNDMVYKLIVENADIGFGLIYIMKNLMLLSLRNRDLIDEVKTFCTDSKEEGPVAEILLEELLEEKRHMMENADIEKEDQFLARCFEHLSTIKEGKDIEAKNFVNLLAQFLEQLEEIERQPNINRTADVIRSCMEIVAPQNIAGILGYAVKLVAHPQHDPNFADMSDTNQFTEMILSDEQFPQLDSEYLQMVLNLLSYSTQAHQNQKENVIHANVLLAKIYPFIIGNDHPAEKQAVLIFLRFVAWIPPVTPKEETSYYYSYTTTTVLRQMDDIENEDPVLHEQRKILMEYILQLDPHLHAYMRQIHTSLKGLFQITLKSSAGVNGYKKFVQLILSTKSYFLLEKKEEDWKLLIEYITNKYRRLRSFCRMLKDSALKNEDIQQPPHHQQHHIPVYHHHPPPVPQHLLHGHPIPMGSYSYPPPPQPQYMMHHQHQLHQLQQQHQTDTLADFELYQDEEEIENDKKRKQFSDSEREKQKLRLL